MQTFDTAELVLTIDGTVPLPLEAEVPATVVCEALKKLALTMVRLFCVTKSLKLKLLMEV